MSRRPYFRLRQEGQPIRFMCAAEGYVMVRRPNCIPFVVPVNEWNAWPECDRKGSVLERKQ